MLGTLHQGKKRLKRAFKTTNVRSTDSKNNKESEQSVPIILNDEQLMLQLGYLNIGEYFSNLGGIENFNFNDISSSFEKNQNRAFGTLQIYKLLCLINFFKRYKHFFK